MIKEVNKQTILVVDDITENIDVLNGILSRDYKIKVALNGEKALKIVKSGKHPDLILLDIMMPGMDGYEVCRRLKDIPATKNIPVIFVTAKGEIEDETKGFELGAVDYIVKPVSPSIVRARVKTHLELKNSRQHIEQLLSKTLLGSIKLLTDILAIVNPRRFSQAARLKRYAHDLAVQLGLPDVWRIEIAALLSQIGIVTIPTQILDKVEKEISLSAQERDLYATYPSMGHDLLENIPRMESVAEMISHQQDTFSVSSTSSNPLDWDIEDLGGQILKVVIDYDRLIVKHNNPKSAILGLRNRGGLYPPFLLDALLESKSEIINRKTDEEALPETLVKVSDLRSGMILEDDIKTEDGAVIIVKGNEISDNILSLIKRFTKHRKIVEPIRILAAGG